MWLSKEDFRIKADNFDPSNGFNIIRIICGLFMFPHVAGKFAAGGVAGVGATVPRRRRIQGGMPSLSSLA